MEELNMLIRWIIIILAFILWMRINNQRLSVTSFQMDTNKIPKEFKGCKLVFLTDLHNNSFGKNNEKLIDEIEKQNPDYIMIAGDMIIGKKDFCSHIPIQLLAILTKKYPVYYALGNHEEKLNTFEETKDSTYVEYKEKLITLGVRFLDNEQVRLTRSNQSICITGLTIGLNYYQKKWKQSVMPKDYIHDLVGEAAKDCYQILLAHNPQYFEHYADWGADLVLAGHVHGGIMILPKLGGVIAPNYQLFPKYDSGQFVQNETTMILSRGLGTHTIKVRIHNKPELVVVQL